MYFFRSEKVKHQHHSLLFTIGLLTNLKATTCNSVKMAKTMDPPKTASSRVSVATSWNINIKALHRMQAKIKKILNTTVG